MCIPISGNAAERITSRRQFQTLAMYFIVSHKEIIYYYSQNLKFFHTFKKIRILLRRIQIVAN